MGVNIYSLELIFIFQDKLAVEIDEKIYTDRDVIFEKKKQEALEKIPDYEFIRLVRVKKVIMRIMKLVEYKHLLINLRTDN